MKNFAHEFKVATKMRKNRNKLVILIGHFDVSALLNLSENWLLATCSTKLSRLHEKLVKSSFPQVNVNPDDDADDAELQLQ